MADLINFTLPTIDEGTDEKTMKQIKNYLFQLTEQMKFYFNNIDTDNFTDAYNQQLNKMATSQTTNSNQLSVTQQTLKKFKDQLSNAMQLAVDRISGNSGGYVILHDSNNDSFPDEILIMNTSDIDTATKIWRWNKEGLMFNNGDYHNASAWNTTVAIDMDGNINANCIRAGTLSGINIQAVHIYGETLIEGGLIKGTRIETDNGKIGAFNIDNSQLTEKGGLFADYNGGVMHYRVFIQPAYYDSSKGTAAKTWVFSTQQYKEGEAGYKGTFVVYADGKCDCNNGLNVDNGLVVTGNLKMDSYLFDGRDYQVIGMNNNLVFGYGAYTLKLPTYIEGGKLLLRHNGDGVEIQKQGTTRMTFNFLEWELSNGKGYRDTIESSGGFVLSANGGNNAMYLVASQIRMGGDLYLNFSASSGTIALAVNTRGIVTTTSSSQRYKENITDVLDDWLNPEKLYELPVKQYNYKSEYKDMELVAGTQIGFIAEDIEKYFPNALIRNQDGQAESWQERIIIPSLLLLVQNLHKEIEVLKMAVKKGE